MDEYIRQYQNAIAVAILHLNYLRNVPSLSFDKKFALLKDIEKQIVDIKRAYIYLNNKKGQ